MLVTRGKICIAQPIIPREKEVQELVYICYCSELTKKLGSVVILTVMTIFTTRTKMI